LRPCFSRWAYGRAGGIGHRFWWPARCWSLAWLALWIFVWAQLDNEKVLLLFAYLTALQAGYLVGAYLGVDTDPNC